MELLGCKFTLQPLHGSTQEFAGYDKNYSEFLAFYSMFLQSTLHTFNVFCGHFVQTIININH